MKIADILITSLVLLTAMLMIVTIVDSFGGWLFFAGFSLWPLVITLVLGIYVKRPASHVLLIVSSLLYCPWFLFIYGSAFLGSPDPQGAIAMVFAGFYSLPVMIPFWVLSWLKREPLN